MNDAEFVAALAEETRSAFMQMRDAHRAEVEELRLEIRGLRESIAAVPSGPPGKDGRDGIDGKDGAPGRDGEDGARGEKGLDGVNGRDGIDGKQGPPGERGEKGMDGKDGRDGLHGKDGTNGRDGVATKDELLALLKETMANATPELAAELKSFVLEEFAKLPILLYRDVYRPGEEYKPGNTATWGGSLWHCNNVTTERPGTGSPDWTLMVKRGTNGKDTVKVVKP
jgi:integrin beta 3